MSTIAEPQAPSSSQTEEVFEWAMIDGQLTKITQYNANGRICGDCGCKCPCRCACCKKGCCSKRLV